MAHLINPMPKVTNTENVPGSSQATPTTIERVDGPGAPAEDAEIRRFEREEAEAMELAFEIALTDETEQDQLAKSLNKASRRLGAAVSELIKASFALIATLAARRLLRNAGARVEAARKHKPTGTTGVQRSTLALANLLGHRFWSRVLGPGRTLLMLGARRRRLVLLVEPSAAQLPEGAGDARPTKVREPPATEARKPREVISLCIGKRHYRPGLGASGLTELGRAVEAQSVNAPTVWAIMGVSYRSSRNYSGGTKNGKPVYRVRRFCSVGSTGDGGFKEIRGYSSTDPADAYRAFYLNPGSEELEKALDEGQEADVFWKSSGAESADSAVFEAA